MQTANMNTVTCVGSRHLTLLISQRYLPVRMQCIYCLGDECQHKNIMSSFASIMQTADLISTALSSLHLSQHDRYGQAFAARLTTPANTHRNEDQPISSVKK